MPCAPASLLPHCSPSKSSGGGDAARPPWALALGAAAAVPVLLLLLIRAARAPADLTSLRAHHALVTPVGLRLRGRARLLTTAARGDPSWRARHPAVPQGQAVGHAGASWGNGDAASAHEGASRWLQPLLAVAAALALVVVVAVAVRAHRRRPWAEMAFGGPAKPQAELHVAGLERGPRPDARSPESGPGRCSANGAASEGTGTQGQRAVPAVIRAVAVATTDPEPRLRLPPPSAKAPKMLLQLMEGLCAGEQRRWLTHLDERLPQHAHDLQKLFDTDHASSFLPKQVRSAAAAAPGVETVVGINVEELTVLHQAFPFETPHSYHFSHYLRHIDDLVLMDYYIRGSDMLLANVQSWCGINRGSDLFISGLGHFHIQDVYDELLQDRRTLMDGVAQAVEDALLCALSYPDPSTTIGRLTLKHALRYSAALRWAPAGWLLRPAELQAFAYFPALRQDPVKLQQVGHILEGTGEKNRVHLIRYRDWWNDLDHANALDEIVSRVRAWPHGGEGMPPPRLLNLLREARRKKTLLPNIRLGHLDDLSDEPATLEGTALRVLRDGETVLNVADQLHNCAANYWRRCCDKQYILAALFDVAGRPLVLAGYKADRCSWSVDQILANWNKQPAPERRERLERFLDTILRWSQQQALRSASS